MSRVASQPTAAGLLSLFASAEVGTQVQMIDAAEVPEPYHTLLVHTHHMTVTVEQFYQQKADVRVLDSNLNGDEYTRQILLTLSGDGRVAQYGVVKIDLAVLTDTVRRDVLAGREPLGRVLINHDVLRQIHPAGYMRVMPGQRMCSWFGLPAARLTYGRLGVISADQRLAIEVLEILAPIDRDRPPDASLDSATAS